jgi:hypothetical protein
MTSITALLWLTLGLHPALFSDTLVVKQVTGVAPTLDGVVRAFEWEPAIEYDFSDTAGRGGTPRPAGSVTMRFLYDSEYVYLACDVRAIHVRQDWDEVCLLADEDRNGQWLPDSSEGEHIIFVHGGLDSVTYAGFPGQCPGCTSASSVTSGNLQFEARIPIGNRRGDYTVHPGDTMGFFGFVAVDGGASFIGWWPQRLLMSQWPNPLYYGDIVLDTAGAGVCDLTQDAPSLSLKCEPNPFSGTTRISLKPQASGSKPLSLRVYDAGGRIVLSRQVPTSSFVLSTSVLAAGVYVVRLDAGPQHATTRIVLQR